MCVRCSLAARASSLVWGASARAARAQVHAEGLQQQLALGFVGVHIAKPSSWRRFVPQTRRCRAITARRLPLRPLQRAAGKSKHEAFARARGCKLRTVEADGKSLPETSDYDSRRIDVLVRAGVVVRLWARG